jgi:predicted flap endonuclease-1-like 5' DNA nuclease
MANILSIEGIGSKYARRLTNFGIRSTDRLLELGAHKRGREDLADQCDIPENLILAWVNIADLMRVKGIGEEYSDLLEEAGVDSVKELRNRKPANLYKKIRESNATRKLVRRIPSSKDVESWVQQAKTLKPMITH